MKHHDEISRAIDYIERNLKNDLTLEDAAKAAGYSKYHFLRLFLDEVGMTPAEYIRKRRLCEIARAMDESDRPMSDIAFELGFNSKENFTRAFRAEHSILPSEYRAARNSLKLCGRVDSGDEPFSINPELVLLEAFRVVAYPSDEEIPPRFWNRYNAGKWSERLSGGEQVEDFGVCRWNAEKCRLDYFIGIRESEAHGDLSGTVRLDIPGGLYAVFATPAANQLEFVNTISKSWDWAAKWLRENGYVRTGGYEFESYVEMSRVFSERIFIPVERKESL